MDFSKEQAVETYKSMIAVGTEALKALQLINGGGVVALLAYLGHVANGPALAHHIGAPLLLFIGGLLSATLAFLFTYFTQFSLLNEFFPEPSPNLIKHMTWLRVTIVSALASIVCFAIGAYAAVQAIAS